MHHNDFLHDQSERVKQYWVEQQTNVSNFIAKTQNLALSRNRPSLPSVMHKRTA